jgi:hypothetical protein
MPPDIRLHTELQSSKSDHVLDKFFPHDFIWHVHKTILNFKALLRRFVLTDIVLQVAQEMNGVNEEHMREFRKILLYRNLDEIID